MSTIINPQRNAALPAAGLDINCPTSCFTGKSIGVQHSQCAHKEGSTGPISVLSPNAMSRQNETGDDSEIVATVILKQRAVRRTFGRDPKRPRSPHAGEFE